MKQLKIHLYLYTDSIGFPCANGQSLQHIWPFLLKDQLESEFGVRIYLCLRGLGGGTIDDIWKIFLRDIGYFRVHGGDTASIVIFNIGVVDAAPQPFTFPLRMLTRIPVAGPRLWHCLQKVLSPNRALLQKIWWYRRTTPKHFRYVFNRMIRQVKRLKMDAISIDTPLTPVSLEARSPGLRKSISLYNSIKHENTDVTHLPMEWVMDHHVLDDGHHFNSEGHRLLADRLLQALQGLISL